MLLTSVMAWIEAPYLTSSSITFTRFFLQAMCSGVKPFCWLNKAHMVKDKPKQYLTFILADCILELIEFLEED